MKKQRHLSFSGFFFLGDTHFFSGWSGVRGMVCCVLAFSLFATAVFSGETENGESGEAERESFDPRQPRTALAAIWELDLKHLARGETPLIVDVAISSDESWVLAVIGKNLVYVKADDGQFGHLPFDEDDTFPLAVAFSPQVKDGNIAVVGFSNGTIFLLEFSDSQMNSLGSHQAHSSPVRAVDISPVANLLLSTAENGEVSIWDANGGESIHQLKGLEGSYVLRARFSPDGKTVAAAAVDGRVLLWSVDTGEVLHRFSGHERAVLDLDFSADSKTVLTASSDRTVRVWSTESGDLLEQLDCTGTVLAAAFAPDGKSLLIPKTSDKRIGLYGEEGGDEAARLGILHHGVVSKVKSGPDGLIVSGDAEGSLIASRLRASHPPRLFDFSLMDLAVRNEESVIRHQIQSGQTLNPLEAMETETEIREKLRLYEVSKSVQNTRRFVLPPSDDELFDAMQMNSSFIRSVDYQSARSREIESGGGVGTSYVLDAMRGGLMGRLMRAPEKEIPLQDTSYFQVVDMNNGEIRLFEDDSPVEDHRQVWYVDVDPYFFAQVHALDPMYGDFKVQDPVVPGEQWEVKTIHYFGGRPSRAFSGDSWGSARHRWIEAAMADSLPDNARIHDVSLWVHYAQRMTPQDTGEMDILKVYGSFKVACEETESHIGEGTLNGRIHMHAPDGPMNGRQLKAVLHLEEPDPEDEEASILTRHEVDLMTSYTHEKR